MKINDLPPSPTKKISENMPLFAQVTVMFGFIDDSLDSLLLPLSACANLLFWWKNMKKIQPHRQVVGIGRSILIAFSFEIIVAILWYYTKTKQWLFLKS